VDEFSDRRLRVGDIVRVICPCRICKEPRKGRWKIKDINPFNLAALARVDEFGAETRTSLILDLCLLEKA
jgi:hypothetical protein